MNYFYARVSTVQQNEARQIDAAERAGIARANIYLDKESGKSFDRRNWKRLCRKIKRGDVLFVKSLDRIGRKYAETIEVWQTLTKKKGVDIVVLDMPLLDTRREKNLLGTFVADLVLQILSFVAENERAHILERQREGIEAAKARGVRFGRVPKRVEGYEEVRDLYLSGKIAGTDAARSLNIPFSTFKARIRTEEKPSDFEPLLKSRVILPDNFDAVAIRWFDAETPARRCAEELGISLSAFMKHAHKRFPDRKSPYFQTSLAAIQKDRRASRVLPDNFADLANDWFERRITAEQGGKIIGTSGCTFRSICKEKFPDRTLLYHYRVTTEEQAKTRYPENYAEIVREWVDGKTIASDAARRLRCSKPTLKRLANKLYPGEKIKAHRGTSVFLRDNFDEIASLWLAGKIRTKEAARRLLISQATFRRIVRQRQEEQK